MQSAIEDGSTLLAQPTCLQSCQPIDLNAKRPGSVVWDRVDGNAAGRTKGLFDFAPDASIRPNSPPNQS